MSTGTLNGIPIERGSLTMSKAGLWTSDVQVMSGVKIAGPVTLVIADASFRGTVVSGDVYAERGWYRIVAGAGGWRLPIDPLTFRNEAGVKLSQVVAAAARAAGETLGIVTDRRIGPAFESPRAEASWALELLAPEGWYVDELGVTHVTERPPVPFTGSLVVMDPKPHRGLQTVAAERILGLRPGCIVNGQAIASVRHELTPEGLRSHLWAELDGWGDRLTAVFRRLVEAFTRRSFYFGRYEYRIATTGATHLDLVPMRSALGLPKLAAVPIRTGSPGCSGTPALGSSCEVQFLDGDPTRPSVVGFDATSTPTASHLTSSGDVVIGDGLGRILRAGDKIAIAGLTSPSGPVTNTPGVTIITLDTTVTIPGIPGAPGVGFSRGLA